MEVRSRFTVIGITTPGNAVFIDLNFVTASVRSLRFELTERKRYVIIKLGSKY